ncbi:hypothetical protein GCM10011607_26860 [Shewanella inventionis]|uniref:Uncharacterized protein n=1 Tax=Shewanella inventionis TaxID=1738770 RepID=A0ABQ1JBJ3_9GAMM|nr:hypothetical protein GCM10011607_26860 [Shewanella inventionis]
MGVVGILYLSISGTAFFKLAAAVCNKVLGIKYLMHSAMKRLVRLLSMIEIIAIHYHFTDHKRAYQWDYEEDIVSKLKTI